MTRLLPILLLAFLWGTPAFAQTTYYVAKAADGGDDGNTCTQAQTISTGKLTIAAGLACLSGGDILTIRNGTYAEGISSTAIPDGIDTNNRTTIQAENPCTGALHDASLSCLVVLNVGALGTYRIAVYANYVDIIGLELDGGGIHLGNSGESSFVKLQSIYAHDVALGSAGMFHGHGGSNIEAYDSWIENVAHVDPPQQVTHGIYITHSDSTYGRNEIRNVSDGGGIHPWHTTFDTVKNVSIFGNRVYDSKVGIYAPTATGCNIWNNLVYGNENQGIRVTSPGSVCNINFNTVHDSGTGILIGSHGNTEIDLGSNISFGNSTNLSDQDADTTLTTNLTDGTDPLFVNAAMGDYHLTSMSPAIDAGTEVVGIADDFDELFRPQGMGFDIGAFEFDEMESPGSGEITWTAPNGGQVFRRPSDATVSLEFEQASPTGNLDLFYRMKAGAACDLIDTVTAAESPYDFDLHAANVPAITGLFFVLSPEGDGCDDAAAKSSGTITVVGEYLP